MNETDRASGRKVSRPSVYTGAGYVPGETGERHRRTGDAKAQTPKRRTTQETAEKKRPERLLKEKEPRRAASKEKRAPRPEKAQTEAVGWQEKLKERRRRKMRRVFECLGGIVAIIYIAVAVYFNFHFYGDTVIYGIDCGRKNAEEVKQEVADRLDDYVLEIQEREGKTETVAATQIGLEYVDNGSVDRMLKAQRSYIWPIMILMDRAKGDSVAFSYDQEKAAGTINALDCMDSVRAVAPRDAYIGTTDDGFEVVQEVMGTTLDREKTVDAILNALDKGAVSVSLEDEDCYINPTVYQDNEQLQSDAAGMSELAKAKITYEFGTQQEVVDVSVIKDWIVKLSDGTFVIDDVCVTDYVESLAAKYDTFGLPVDFYTSLGTTVTLSGGDYGWCIDQGETTVQLMNALQDGYQGTLEPVYLYEAMSHENGGIGYTYVEICISQQRMWCYENGNVVVDTPVVTGNPNKGNATPSGGVWAIDAKKRDAILTGEGYTAPVDYWMPFNGDVGIHDLKERAAFGGTIYLSNGSHGCVNTPYDQVQIIYNTVSIGTPVIVYD